MTELATVDLECIVCMEICVTVTECDHSLCRRCYKSVITHPQSNMRRCPYCRKEHLVLSHVERVLTAEQRDIHYRTLLESFNEMYAVCAPRPQLKKIILEYGLNRVVDQNNREIDYSCPLYDANRESMGTLGEIKCKSYNRKVVNKHGVLLGDVDEVALYYDTDVTYFA
jgi:hypothetical protein